MFEFIIFTLLISVTTGFESLSIKGRINGGRDADITEVPFIVSIRFNGVHICGGSIIHESVTLTTAACLDW